MRHLAFFPHTVSASHSGLWLDALVLMYAAVFTMMQNVRKGVISNIVEENVLQPLLVSTRCALLSRLLLRLLPST